MARAKAAALGATVAVLSGAPRLLWSSRAVPVGDLARAARNGAAASTGGVANGTVGDAAVIRAPGTIILLDSYTGSRGGAAADGRLCQDSGALGGAALPARPAYTSSSLSPPFQAAGPRGLVLETRVVRARMDPVGPAAGDCTRPAEGATEWRALCFCAAVIHTGTPMADTSVVARRARGGPSCAFSAGTGVLGVPCGCNRAGASLASVRASGRWRLVDLGPVVGVGGAAATSGRNRRLRAWGVMISCSWSSMTRLAGRVPRLRLPRGASQAAQVLRLVLLTSVHVGHVHSETCLALWRAARSCCASIVSGGSGRVRVVLSRGDVDTALSLDDDDGPVGRARRRDGSRRERAREIDDDSNRRPR